MTKTDKDNETKFTLRLPKKIRQRVDADAKANYTSRHAMILRILSERYEQPKAA